MAQITEGGVYGKFLELNEEDCKIIISHLEKEFLNKNSSEKFYELFQMIQEVANAG